jgi:hypothetical protein
MRTDCVHIQGTDITAYLPVCPVFPWAIIVAGTDQQYAENAVGTDSGGYNKMSIKHSRAFPKELDYSNL